MSIGAAHRGELVACPLVGSLHIRRAGQPGPDAVHQSGGILHDVRMGDALIPNALIHREIEIFLRGLRKLIGRLCGLRISVLVFLDFLICGGEWKRKSQQ